MSYKLFAILLAFAWFAFPALAETGAAAPKAASQPTHGVDGLTPD